MSKRNKDAMEQDILDNSSSSSNGARMESSSSRKRRVREDSSENAASNPTRDSQHNVSVDDRKGSSDKSNSGEASTSSICEDSKPFATREKVSVRKKSKLHGSKKPDDMPRRPLSAYNLFFKETRARMIEEVQTKQPDRKTLNIKFEDLAKLIGRKWKEHPEDGKARYKELAKEELARYRSETEAYQLQLVRKSREAREEASRKQTEVAVPSQHLHSFRVDEQSAAQGFATMPPTGGLPTEPFAGLLSNLMGAADPSHYLRANLKSQESSAGRMASSQTDYRSLDIRLQELINILQLQSPADQYYEALHPQQRAEETPAQSEARLLSRLILQLQSPQQNLPDFMPYHVNHPRATLPPSALGSLLEQIRGIPQQPRPDAVDLSTLRQRGDGLSTSQGHENLLDILSSLPSQQNISSAQRGQTSDITSTLLNSLPRQLGNSVTQRFESDSRYLNLVPDVQASQRSGQRSFFQQGLASTDFPREESRIGTVLNQPSQFSPGHSHPQLDRSAILAAASQANLLPLLSQMQSNPSNIHHPTLHSTGTTQSAQENVQRRSQESPNADLAAMLLALLTQTRRPDGT